MNGRRTKSLLLVTALVFAGLALMSWTQTWFSVTLADSAAAEPALTVTGDVGAPALSALALASLAATGALAIAGRVFRVILGVLQLVLGGCIALSAILALANTQAAVEPVVTSTTGVAGSGPVSALISTIEATAWPTVALASGLLISMVSILGLVTARAWPNSGRKYEPVRFENATAGDSAISDWDSLSQGADPTSGTTAPGDPTVGGKSSSG